MLKTDPKEVEQEVDWIHLAEDRDQRWAALSTFKNLWVPEGMWHLVISQGTIRFARRALLRLVSQ